MKKSSNLLIADLDQKTPEQWQIVNRFVEEWNQKHEAVIQNMYDMWCLKLDDIENNPTYFVLKQSLEQLAKKEGIIYHLSIDTTFDETDFNNADFIQMFAISLDSLDTPFALNEATIMQEEECPKCGCIILFDYKQVEDFKVDESLIMTQLEDHPKQAYDNWDLIDSAGGRMIISARCRMILEQQKAKGYSLHPVYNAEGKVSTKLFQLKVDKAIIVPHYQSLGNTEFFCTSCGTNHIHSSRTDFDLDPKEIGDLDFFAQSRSKASLICISNRIYKAFKAAKINGMHPADIANFY